VKRLRGTLALGIALTVLGMSPICASPSAQTSPASSILSASEAEGDAESRSSARTAPPELRLQTEHLAGGRPTYPHTLSLSREELLTDTHGLGMITLAALPSGEILFAVGDEGSKAPTLREGSAPNRPSRAPLKRIGDDLHVIWGGPVHLSSRRLLPLIATTGLLLALDETTTDPWFDEHFDDRGRARSLANATNDLGGWQGIAAMGGLYALGGRRDKDTAKLAIAAAIDSTLITSVLKFSLGRERPSEGGERTVFRPFSTHSSMPSGHATAAFAMATVLSHRYPKRKWLFYALATSVAFARIQRDRHFLSDVFLGGAVGAYGAQRVLANEGQILTYRF